MNKQSLINACHQTGNVKPHCHQALRFFLAIVFLAVGVTAPNLFGQTAALADCVSAGGPPTDAQATAACNNNGCPGSWTWANPPNSTIQECTYSISLGSAGAPSAWLPGSTIGPVDGDNCGSAGGSTVTGSQSDTVSTTETITVSAQYSQSVQASVNGELESLISVGLQVTAEFQAGVSAASSKAISSTFTSSMSVPVPACGKVLVYGCAFSATQASHCTATFVSSGICSGCANGNWVTVASYPKTLTANANGGATKWTDCDVDCGNEVPNEACSASATANGSCAWNTFP